MEERLLRAAANVSYLARASLHIDSDVIAIEKSDLSSFFIANDYDTLHLPIFSMFISLSEENYAKVVKNRDKVKLHFKLQRSFGMHGVEQEKKELIFNRMFKIYTTDARPFLEESRLGINAALSTSNDDLKDETNNLTKSENMLEITAFTDDVTNNSYVINEVLSSANMTDAVGVVLGRPSYEEILMEPLDNKSTYSEVLIPPYTTVANIDYLHNQYGLYETGYIFFAGLDRTYLISKDRKCRAKEKDEYEKVIIRVSKDDTADSIVDGSIKDEDAKVYYVRVAPMTVQAEALAITNNAINGNKKQFVYPMTGAMKTAEEGENNGAVNRQVLANRYNSKFVHTEAENNLKQNNIRLTIPVSGVDIDALTPNKEFVVKFDDSKAQKEIGGTYRLVTSQFSFKPSGEKTYLVDGILVLTK